MVIHFLICSFTNCSYCVAVKEMIWISFSLLQVFVANFQWSSSARWAAVKFLFAFVFVFQMVQNARHRIVLSFQCHLFVACLSGISSEVALTLVHSPQFPS